MATTVGVLTYGTGSNVSLVCPNASGGTGPYTYQWYRSTVSGFTPGAPNIITGATSQALNDVPPLPNTIYYYICVATDTITPFTVGNSPQFAVNSGDSVKASTQVDMVQVGDATKSLYGFGTGNLQN